jgi:hypothetical protein
MSQWLIEALRKRSTDKAKALRAAADVRSSEFRRLAASYDAFVPAAESIRDGILLGTAEASDGRAVPIRLGCGDEYAHWTVQGGTGSGKTCWVSSILFQELSRGRPFGLMDCKGDLFHSMIRWTAALGRTVAAPVREVLRQRLTVLNPFGAHLVPLNVCRPLPGIPPEAQAYEITLALSRLFDDSLGVHMENILRHLILLLVEAGLSLNEAPLVLQDEVLRGVLALRSTNPTVKQFFLGNYPLIPQVSKDALLNRLQALFLATPVRLMLGADEIVDFKAIFERGDPLFIFLGKGAGVPEEQVQVLGSLIVQLLLQAAYARGHGAHTGYLLAIDEYFHLWEGAPGLARRFQTALTTARSFGLSLLLISHNFAQLPPTLREIVLGNCDLAAVFRTSKRNALFFGDFLPDIDQEVLARVLREGSRSAASPHEMRRHQTELVQRLPSRTCFWWDKRQPHDAIRIRVPDLPTPHEFAGVSEDALERIIDEEGWDRGVSALPKEALKMQIEARAQRLHALVHPPIVLTQAMGVKTTHAPRRSPSRPALG